MINFKALFHRIQLKPILRKMSIVFFVLSSGANANSFTKFASQTINNAPEVNIAIKEIEISEVSKSIAWSKYLPQLTTSIKGGHKEETYEDTGKNSFTDTSARVDLSQDIINISKYYEIKGSKKGIEKSVAELITVQQDVLLEFATKWARYWKELRQLEVGKENEKILESYQSGSRERYKAGELTITDVRLAESRYQAARAKKIGFLKSSYRAKESLIDRMGCSLPRLGSIELLSINLAPFAKKTIKENISQHPSIKALKVNLSQINFRINQQKSAHLPTLKLVANYEHKPSGEYDSSRYGFDESYIGLEMNLPIYQGGKTVSQTKKVVLEKMQTMFEVTELTREINRNIQTATYDLEQSNEELSVAIERLKYAQETLDWMIEEFDAGTRTSLDVFLAEADMIDAKLELITIKEQLFLSHFNYLYAIGELNIETIRANQILSEQG